LFCYFPIVEISIISSTYYSGTSDKAKPSEATQGPPKSDQGPWFKKQVSTRTRGEGGSRNGGRTTGRSIVQRRERRCKMMVLKV